MMQMDYHKPDQQTVQALKNIAARLRINSIRATTAAGSERGWSVPDGAGGPCVTYGVSERIHIRVIDPFTIKPLDSKTIIDNARATRGRIITVEDHYHEGALGEAVCSVAVNEPGVTVTRLAVSRVPRSGKPQELLRLFGLDRDAIAQAVRKLLSANAM
uniref:transketolase n=1 Tax=Knipowitschia caucasica TaxID=637954 RepID=A0AAV2M219_KNICA